MSGLAALITSSAYRLSCEYYCYDVDNEQTHLLHRGQDVGLAVLVSVGANTEVDFTRVFVSLEGFSDTLRWSGSEYHVDCGNNLNIHTEDWVGRAGGDSRPDGEGAEGDLIEGSDRTTSKRRGKHGCWYGMYKRTRGIITFQKVLLGAGPSVLQRALSYSGGLIRIKCLRELQPIWDVKRLSTTSV